MADGSRIKFEVVVRTVRHRGSWWVQALEALLLESPSARPEYDTPPFAVVMTAAATGTKLPEFPAQSHDAAREHTSAVGAGDCRGSDFGRALRQVLDSQQPPPLGGLANTCRSRSGNDREQKPDPEFTT